MAILEGMAAGLPVLATDVGGIGRMVVAGETGLLVPPADPGALADGLLTLATDRERRVAMGQAGRARCAERWGSERMVDSYLEVLGEAAASRRRRGRRGRFRRPLAQSCLDWIESRGWVTWERYSEQSSILLLTNIWPEPGAPTRAPFFRATVDGLAAAGVNPDLLYVRGYRGVHCYLAGAAVMALLPLAHPGKYRLVHSHAGETALVARFFWGAPVLATYWGSDIQGLAGQGRTSEKIRFAVETRLLCWHALSMSATTTKSTEMEARLPRRARARNWVIPDGIDVERFRPIDRREARAALGWPPDAPTIITVGRRSAEKRLWLAERAAALAGREIEGLDWRPVSDAAPEDMPLYYSAADLLLHTAASEGSPNVIKEAMACNLPVLATDVGDIAELLAGVQPSAVCAASAEADELAREAVRLLRLGRRSDGRERIAPYRIEVTTARTLDCYRRLRVVLPE